VTLWNVANPAHPVPAGQLSVGDLKPVASIAFSPDGNQLAVVSLLRVTFWQVRDRSSPRQQGEFAPPDQYGPMSTVDYRRDGRTVAVGTYSGSVDLVDLTSGDRPHYSEHPGHSGQVIAVAFSPDGSTLASASADSTIRLWDVNDPKQLRPIGQPLTGHLNWVEAATFSTHGQLLIIGRLDDGIINWLGAAPAHPAQLTPGLVVRPSAIRSVALAPDEQTLAVGSYDRHVALWDLSPLNRLLVNPRRTACSLTGGL